MTIEATSPGNGIAKPTQTATAAKGKGTPAIAGDASGFFAMLSAADDALVRAEVVHAYATITLVG